MWPEKTDEHPPFAIKPGKNSKVHTNLLIAYISRPRHCFLYLSVEVYISTVELGDKELFGHPRIVPYLMPNVPYPYEDKLALGSRKLTPICSLSKRSLSPKLTVVLKNLICGSLQQVFCSEFYSYSSSAFLGRNVEI